jgi:hypothetical protein
MTLVIRRTKDRHIHSNISIVGESSDCQRHQGELRICSHTSDGGLIQGLAYVAWPALGPMHMRLIRLMQVTRQSASCASIGPRRDLVKNAIASDPTWLSAISQVASPPFEHCRRRMRRRRPGKKENGRKGDQTLRLLLLGVTCA